MTTEMKSPPIPNAEEGGPNALAAIQKLLDNERDTTAEPARKPTKRKIVITPKETASEKETPFEGVTSKPSGRAPRKLQSLPILPPAPKAKPVRAPGPLSKTMSRVTGYRPTRRHLALAGLAALVILRPWLVFWSVVFSLFALIGVFLFLGYDGFWQRAMRLGRWYAKRRPERAVELNRKLDAFAMKWDMILDHFPDGTVDALYMPDFSEMATSERRHDEALDRRLSNLSEGEA